MSKTRDAVIEMVNELIREVITETLWYYTDSISEGSEGPVYTLSGGGSAHALNHQLFESGENVLVIRTMDGKLWLYKPTVYRSPIEVKEEDIYVPIDLAAGGYPTYYLYDAAYERITVRNLETNEAAIFIPYANDSPSDYSTLIMSVDQNYNAASANLYSKFRYVATTALDPESDWSVEFSHYVTTLAELNDLLLPYIDAAASGTLPVSATRTNMVFEHINTIIRTSPMSIPDPAGTVAGCFAHMTGPGMSGSIFKAVYAEYADAACTALNLYRELYVNSALVYSDNALNATTFDNDLVVKAITESGCLYSIGADWYLNDVKLDGTIPSGGYANLVGTTVYTPSGSWQSGTFYPLVTRTTPEFTALNDAGYVNTDSGTITQPFSITRVAAGELTSAELSGTYINYGSGSDYGDGYPRYRSIGASTNIKFVEPILRATDQMAHMTFGGTVKINLPNGLLTSAYAGNGYYTQNTDEIAYDDWLPTPPYAGVSTWYRFGAGFPYPYARVIKLIPVGTSASINYTNAVLRVVSAYTYGPVRSYAEITGHGVRLTLRAVHYLTGTVISESYVEVLLGETKTVGLTAAPPGPLDYYYFDAVVTETTLPEVSHWPADLT